MMVDLKANTLVITLTVHGLNDPIKWRHDHFVQKKKKNQNLVLCCLQEAILNILRFKKSGKRYTIQTLITRKLQQIYQY